jgi:glycosyltransferase involved in cell wall biosynthesis
VPAVSVIVPNYNHARFLPRRLDSILNQSFDDIEVIILDDASSDNSHDVITSYLADPRVRFYPNKTNSGSPFIQWNRGIQLAEGNLVWIAESDDYAEGDFLASLVPLLREQPKLGLVYCQSWRVDSKGHVSDTLEDWTVDLDLTRWKTSFVNEGANECKNYLIWKNTVPNASAVLLRKDVFLQSGGAPVDMRLCGDWMTWVRMLQISDIAYFPASLNYFRKHDATVRETTHFRKHFDEKWRVQHFILKSCKLPVPVRRQLAEQILNEFMARVRAAGPYEHWHEIVKGINLFWPILAHAPGTAFNLAVRRALQSLQRRILSNE